MSVTLSLSRSKTARQPTPPPGLKPIHYVTFFFLDARTGLLVDLFAQNKLNRDGIQELAKGIEATKSSQSQ